MPCSARFFEVPSYTRLGQVDDPAGLEQVLGKRGVHVLLTKE
jgi:hypothetical protein